MRSALLELSRRSPTAAPQVITQAELGELMLDVNVPDEEIARYLRLAPGKGGDAFTPVIEINPDLVRRSATGRMSLYPCFNSMAHWRREMRYRNKVSGWGGPRLVSEGDSWEQYPFLLLDIWDNLDRDHAILSLGGAGDLVEDMIHQGELVEAVIAERPHAVILSAGGNDLLGSGRLRLYLEPFAPGRAAEEYLGARFNEVLTQIVKDYELLLGRVLEVMKVPIFFHCYDYAVPIGGRWLGQPMALHGIEDPQMQAAIIRAIVDRFFVALTAMTERAPFAGHTHLVDCRGKLCPALWFDELHPTNEGFAIIAHEFRKAIARHFRMS